MKENGIIIFTDGSYKTFGLYVCPDCKQYFLNESHEESFKKEVLPSFEFRLSNLEYNNDTNIYNNAFKFSLEGIIMIFNNKESIRSKDRILCYVPNNPTSEQIDTLCSLDQLKGDQIQDIYEFFSDDLDDYYQYDKFKDYILEKTGKIKD